MSGGAISELFKSGFQLTLNAFGKYLFNQITEIILIVNFNSGTKSVSNVTEKFYDTFFENTVNQGESEIDRNDLILTKSEQRQRIVNILLILAILLSIVFILPLLIFICIQVYNTTQNEVNYEGNIIKNLILPLISMNLCYRRGTNHE